MHSQLKTNNAINLNIGALFQSRFCQRDSQHLSKDGVIENMTSDHEKISSSLDATMSCASSNTINKSINERLTEEEECVFWYSILYAIGSYMIEAARNVNNNDISAPDIPKKPPTKESLTPPSEIDIMYDHIITRLFCGYWILYTIAVHAENTKKTTRK